MKKISTLSLKGFFKSKRSIRLAISILTLITMYYSITTFFYLAFLVIVIINWVFGAKDVKFFNIINSKEIHRAGISYFTTGDILNSIKLLFIIATLLIAISLLRKKERKLS